MSLTPAGGYIPRGPYTSHSQDDSARGCDLGVSLQRFKRKPIDGIEVPADLVGLSHPEALELLRTLIDTELEAAAPGDLDALNALQDFCEAMMQRAEVGGADLDLGPWSWACQRLDPKTLRVFAAACCKHPDPALRLTLPMHRREQPAWLQEFTTVSEVVVPSFQGNALDLTALLDLRRLVLDPSPGGLVVTTRTGCRVSGAYADGKALKAPSTVSNGVETHVVRAVNLNAKARFKEGEKRKIVCRELAIQMVRCWHRRDQLAEEGEAVVDAAVAPDGIDEFRDATSIADAFGGRRRSSADDDILKCMMSSDRVALVPIGEMWNFMVDLSDRLRDAHIPSINAYLSTRGHALAVRLEAHPEDPSKDRLLVFDPNKTHRIELADNKELKKLAGFPTSWLEYLKTPDELKLDADAANFNHSLDRCLLLFCPVDVEAADQSIAAGQPALDTTWCQTGPDGLHALTSKHAVRLLGSSLGMKGYVEALAQMADAEPGTNPFQDALDSLKGEQLLVWKRTHLLIWDSTERGARGVGFVLEFIKAGVARNLLTRQQVEDILRGPPKFESTLCSALIRRRSGFVHAYGAALEELHRLGILDSKAVYRLMKAEYKGVSLLRVTFGRKASQAYEVAVRNLHAGDVLDEAQAAKLLKAIRGSIGYWRLGT